MNMPLQSARMRTGIIVAIALFLSTLAIARGTEKTTWELQNQNWTPVDQATSAPANEPALDQAERLLVNGHPGEAKETLLDWEEEHKTSPARDRCLYLVAEAFYQLDNRIKAFYYLDELMDTYPASNLFDPALNKQFEIAEAFINGYKRKFLFFRILDATDEGVVMLYRIQQRSPGSPLAEKALLHTADFYFADKQYDLAVDAYQSYARSYPRSPAIPRVRLRAAFASLAQFHGVKFDATPIIDARAQLLDIQREYPELAKEENLESAIEQIDGAFAKKILTTAEFYERTHEPKAAVYDYRYLAQAYPTAPEAATARQRLASMSADDLSEPPPPANGGFAPTTQPATELH